MYLNNQSRILLLILLTHTVSVSGIQHVEVSWVKQNICALRESSVNITCSYSNINIATGFWFNLKDKAKWWKEEHPEDLTLDSDYAGRVNYTKMTNFSSTLTITDLRERDSGEYHLMFITDKGEEYRSSVGVSLTVTDLQVTRDPTKPALTCKTSCLLSSDLQQYHWYQNGQWIRKPTDTMKTFSMSNDAEESYSCSVPGYNNIFALPLCVGGNCWNVTYTNRRVCVLEGSSVELTGIYSYPSDHRVQTVFWHFNKDLSDLKPKMQFTNRVEYVKQDRNCTMKIKNPTKKDTGEYHLRFFSIRGGGFSGKPGVILNVTDLQVRVSHSAVISDQTPVTLSCITSCTLSNNPTYMWYKNGQPVTNKLTKHNKLYLKSSEDTGDYSCAVRGREDLRPPEVTVTLPEIDPDEDENRIPIIVGMTVFLLVIIITGALCMWRKKSKSVQIPSSNKGTDPQSEQQDDEVHYSSIHFTSQTQGLSLPKFPRDAAEDEPVQYAEVKLSTAAT